MFIQAFCSITTPLSTCTHPNQYKTTSRIYQEPKTTSGLNQMDIAIQQ